MRRWMWGCEIGKNTCKCKGGMRGIFSKAVYTGLVTLSQGFVTADDRLFMLTVAI